MKTKKTDGIVVDSWFQFPKASDSIFKDGRMIVLEESKEDKKEPVLRYCFE